MNFIEMTGVRYIIPVRIYVVRYFFSFQITGGGKQIKTLALKAKKL
jgi:hypothetical protein